MPLVSDFVDVLQEFANADLMPATYERAQVATYQYGIPVEGTDGYVDQGPLPVGETVIVPAELETYAERDDRMPAGDRPRGRIIVYTSVQLRAGRSPDLGADVVVTADGRRWRVVHAEDWSASGNFWTAHCDLIDADPAS